MKRYIYTFSTDFFFCLTLSNIVKSVVLTVVFHADIFLYIQRHTAQLREELLKLPCPEGLDPDSEDSPEKCSATSSSEETLLHEQVKPSSSKDIPTDFKL